MNHSQNYYQNCLAGRAKAGGSQVQSQPGLKTKTLPHKKKKRKRKRLFWSFTYLFVVIQADLKLLGSSNPPVSASRVVATAVT
jgi:hypothetical protein